MRLEGKTVLVFAAGGAIGDAVTRRLAKLGARVFATFRSEEGLSALRDLPGISCARVDASDDRAVRQFVDHIAETTGCIDLVFNAIGPRAAEAAYATPAVELSHEKFLLPIVTIAGSQFLTARAAARHMLRQGQGSIVLLSASLSGLAIPLMSGITAACGAVEALVRPLAAEFGPHGVRVNCVRAGGMPETRTIRETNAAMARALGATPEAVSSRTMANLLQRPVRLDEAAAAVAFLASDDASGMTGQVVSVCAGATVA
jgi:NAD(P)-dependent dehydrogenase (short-subunit alcohol dehydrogenase family)